MAYTCMSNQHACSHINMRRLKPQMPTKLGQLLCEKERDDVLMACIAMFNANHPPFCAPLSPRISFSSDFVEVVDELSRGCIKRADRTLAASSSSPGDADFEFSVSNFNMLTADQLFHQGRMLPFRGDRGGRSSGKKVTTLRDELCGADQEALPSRPPKGCRRWKKILGFKTSHNVPPKKPTPHLERVDEKAPYRPDIDIRDERKIWGWREESAQSSYRWVVRDNRDLEEEEEEEEGEREQEQQEDD